MHVQLVQQTAHILSTGPALSPMPRLPPGKLLLDRLKRSCRASFTTSSQVSLTHWLTGLRLCELAVEFTLFSGKEELHRLGADLRITAQVGLVWLGSYNSAGSVLLSSWDLTAHQPIAHTWST